MARKQKLEPPKSAAELEVSEKIGSKGWNTRGYLPHYDAPGTLQFVTFRLGDAMPPGLRHEWDPLLKIQDEREQRIRLEEYLDRGLGACILRRHDVARIVEDVLLAYDGDRYRLAAWVIMPNHVHVVVELWLMSSGRLLKAWKGTSAREVNRLLNRRGSIWQEDYWDRYIRDETHFRRARNYTESNPVKAGLTPFAAQWLFSSANEKWRWTGPNRYTNARLIRGALSLDGPIFTSAGVPVKVVSEADSRR